MVNFLKNVLHSPQNTIEMWGEHKNLISKIIALVATLIVVLIIVRINNNYQTSIWSNIYLKSHIVAKHAKIHRSIQILETINNTNSQYSVLSSITKINILYNTMLDKKILKKIEDAYLFIEKKNHLDKYIQELTVIIDAWNNTDKIFKKNILKNLILIKKSHSMWKTSTLELLGINAIKLSKLEKTQKIHNTIIGNNITHKNIDVGMSAICTITKDI
jgi:hypothetical protein